MWAEHRQCASAGAGKTGQRWSKTPEEIGAANALVFNPDGTVTAVSEGHRHGVGSALVQRARTKPADSMRRNASVASAHASA
jgi:hypothetical protein